VPARRPDPGERWVVIGEFGAPFGIKGWVRVRTYTRSPEAIGSYPTWWVGKDRREAAVEQVARSGRGVVAKLAGCDDPESTAALRGQEIAVPREALAAPGSDEYYWIDLIGLRVENLEGVELGQVTGVIETGANAVLQVAAERERLIPFVAAVIREVDLGGGRIRVDWGADY
jgi:16S rRNA processing protein RimM